MPIIKVYELSSTATIQHPVNLSWDVFQDSLLHLIILLNKASAISALMGEVRKIIAHKINRVDE